MSVASAPHIIRRGASVMSIAYKYYRQKLSAGNPRRGKKGTRFPYDLPPGFRPTGRGNFTGSRTDCKPRANNGLFWVKRGFRGVRVPPSAPVETYRRSVDQGAFFGSTGALQGLEPAGAPRGRRE